MWLNDLIVILLSVGGGRRAAVEMRHQKLGDSVETVEEGQTVELTAINAKVTGIGKTRTRMTSTRQKRD